MNLTHDSRLIIGWLLLTNVWTFVLFGFDKWRAKRDRSRRVSEFSLLLISALGGWPGGLLGILFFRHKSTKPSFLLKFFVAFIVFVFLVANAHRLLSQLNS